MRLKHVGFHWCSGLRFRFLLMVWGLRVEAFCVFNVVAFQVCFPTSRCFAERFAEHHQLCPAVCFESGAEEYRL